MTELNAEYLQYLQADLQQAREQFDKCLEAYKEAERRIIGSQYALQVATDYFSKASQQGASSSLIKN